MKVIVFIPLFNKAPYIKEAIESVLNQTYSDFELVIIDDGSVDGGQEIVKSFSDSRITFYQNDYNLGTAGIANRIFELTNSKYIIRLDADDLMLPNRIKLQVELMEANSEIMASSGALTTFGSAENQHWKLPESHDKLFARILFHTPIIQGASIVRSEFVKTNKLSYDSTGPQIGEDWLFWFKMALKGAKFANTPAELISYRQNSNNITNYFQHDFYENRKLMYSYFFKELNLPLDKVDIHFLTKPYFQNNFSANHINEFWQWCDYLINWNLNNRIFDIDEFKNVVLEKWKNIFYHLPERGNEYVKTYKKCNGGLEFSQWKYNCKFRLNQFIKRKK